MHFSRRFYTLAAVASFASVATTLLLIFLPRLYAPVDDLESRLLLVGTWPYQLRAWTYLLHPFVVGVAAFAMGTVLARRAAGATLLGAIAFFVWAITEAGQQALTLVAYHGWARQYLSSGAQVRAVIASHIAVYDGIWAAMFLLLLIGFLLGNLCYGLVLIRGRGRDRTLGVLFLVIAGLSVFNVSGHLGGPELPAWLGPWLYPIVQPVTRVLIGLWLLAAAKEVAEHTG